MPIGPLALLAQYQVVEFPCLLKLLAVTIQHIQFMCSWMKEEVPGIQCLPLKQMMGNILVRVASRENSMDDQTAEGFNQPFILLIHKQQKIAPISVNGLHYSVAIIIKGD